MTVEPIDVLLKGATQSNNEDDEGQAGLLDEEQDKSLHLKGQMMFMAEWNVIMFLCSPSLPDLDTLAFSGLYINDLSMHDFSRDLLLASQIAVSLLPYSFKMSLTFFTRDCLVRSGERNHSSHSRHSL
jgi:hypothetical protein